MTTGLSIRQLEILEASGKLLMDKGIMGMTTKNLAQEMNFSESALYRHFKDKEAIVTHLIGYLSENINQRFAAITAKNLNAVETLSQLFASQFSFFKNNPHFIVIVLSDSLIDNSSNIRSEILKLMQSNAGVFLKVVKDGQEKGQLSNEIEPEDLVHVIIGSFRLQMLKWKLADFSFDIEKKGMKTMETVLSLIKTKND